MNAVEVNKSDEVLKHAVGLGLTDIQANILAARTDDVSMVNKIINPKAASIPEPGLMKDMSLAADIVIEAINNRQKIMVVCDFDVDGISSAAIIHQFFKYWINAGELHSTYVTHRKKAGHGYGFSSGAADEILELAELPDLIVTVDLGSSNENEINDFLDKAMQKGKEVKFVVTDHHHIPESGGPTRTDAFVNPQRNDCGYPDKTVCGATVAFLLCWQIHQKLLASNAVQPKSLVSLLSYAAGATISDCVSLSSEANRAIVKTGLKHINNQTFPVWSAIQNGHGSYVDEVFLGFNLGPKINSSSRMGHDGLDALNFLTADSIEDSWLSLEKITSTNDQRKAVQNQMLDEALEMSRKQVLKGCRSIMVNLEDGDPGVSGIVASRLKDSYGLPAFMFAPINDFELTGSARSIGSIDIRTVIENVSKKTDAVVRFGGHKMAAGMTIKKSKLQEFHNLINDEMALMYPDQDMTKVMIYDQQIDIDQVNSDVFAQLSMLSPYGKGFDSPTFLIKGQISEAFWMGKEKDSLKILAKNSKGEDIELVWFGAKKQPEKVENLEAGGYFEVIGEVAKNDWASNKWKRVITQVLIQDGQFFKGKLI